ATARTLWINPSLTSDLTDCSARCPGRDAGFTFRPNWLGLLPPSPTRGRALIRTGRRGPTVLSPKETLRMKKTFIAIAAAASLGLATMSAPTTAEARCWGFGCAIAVGIGVATGVAIGTAVANSAYPAYAPVAGYAPYPAYGAPVPVACPGGY